MRLPVAILAGGLALRMRPLTTQFPKSLIRVAGDFFICHQLRYLKQQGINEVVLCVGHLGEQIETLISDGKNFGLQIEYSWDGDSLLGTGGALKKALPLLGQAFFVLYGDSYLPTDFAAVEGAFFENSQKALMTVFKNRNLGDRSNVLFKNNRLLEYNKKQQKLEMEHIDYGLSILSASVLNDYSAGEAFDLAEFFHALSLEGKLFGCEVFERFYEIGSMAGLAEVEDYFSGIIGSIYPIKPPLPRFSSIILQKFLSRARGFFE